MKKYDKLAKSKIFIISFVFVLLFIIYSLTFVIGQAPSESPSERVKINEKTNLSDFLEKDFNPQYGVIKIEEKNVSVVSYSLIYNTPYCFKECEARGKAVLEKEGVLFSDLKFLDKFGVNVNPNSYQIYIKTGEKKLSKKEIISTMVTIKEDAGIIERDLYGLKSFTEEIWEPYNFKKLNKGEYEWKIVATKSKPSSSMDWIAKTGFGDIPLSEWEWWDGVCDSGNGTLTDPCIITSWGQLDGIRTNITAHYKLGNSLNSSTANYSDFAGPSANASRGWSPLGTYDEPFQGTFDGGGYSIDDLYINSTNERKGLFAVTFLSSISNLNMDNVSINGNGRTGSVVGENWYTNLYNISVNGTIVSPGDRAGGIVGINLVGSFYNVFFKGNVTGGVRAGGLVGSQQIFSSDETIEIFDSGASGIIIGAGAVGTAGLVALSIGLDMRNSSFTGVVSSSGNRVGGLVGNLQDVDGYENVIKNSYASGNVSCGGLYCGGLIGMLLGGNVINSFFNGSVNSTGDSTSGDIAGLVGHIQEYYHSTLIERSYSLGTVTASESYTSVGGLVGGAYGMTIKDSYSRSNVSAPNAEDVGGLVGAGATINSYINNSYSTGKVSGKAMYGGLIGGNWGEVIILEDSFWDTQTSGQGSSDGGIGKTTAQMQNISTFTGWDFTNVWDINGVNDGYPYLNSNYILVNINEPIDGSYYSDNDSILLDFEVDSNYDIQSCWYNVFNSSGSEIISNTTITGCTNTNFSLPGDSVNYTINLYAKDILDNEDSNSSTFEIDKVKPLIQNFSVNYIGYVISFEADISDNSGLLGSCFYSLYDSSSIVKENITFTCNTEQVVSVSYPGEYTLVVYARDSSGNTNNTSTSLTIVGGGGAGAGGSTIVTVTKNITVNKTTCGDLICQRDGNDFGIKEDYWNCQQDCPGAVGENLDNFVYHLTSYCFDKDIETLCYWTQGWSGKSVQDRIKVEEGENNSVCGDNICQSNENNFNCESDCGKISTRSFVNYCVDKDDSTPCFWKTNLAIYLSWIIILPTIYFFFFRRK